MEPTALLESVRALTGLHGVSGYEDPVIEWMATELGKLTDEVSVDALGNVIALRRGENASLPRLMLCAHMDEVGYVLRNQEAMGGGFRVMSVAANPRAMPGQEVMIRSPEGWSGSGVVGLKSLHLSSAPELEHALRVEDLLVYPAQAEDGSAAATPGSTVSFRSHFKRMPGGLVCAKAMDDRAGCAILLEVARRLQQTPLPGDLLLVGTVQEEISCDGGLAPAREARAGLVIGVDAAPAYDTPETHGLGEVALGQGPVIFRMLRALGLNGWTPNPSLALHLEAVARGLELRTQRDALFGYMCDTKPLRHVPLPSAVLGFPTRHLHSPAETVAISDLEAIVRILVEIASHPESIPDLRRGKARGPKLT